MSPYAIVARGLSKRFTRQRAQGHALRQTIERAAFSPLTRSRNGDGASRNGALWALRDVSFEIKHGECVALIGHNGAGKSLLLRILARITRPTYGEADLYGRVGAVLDVGVGFNRELSARENIFLQGAILGIKRQELARRYDAIVAFSEMEEFLEEPLKRFSNGMQVRLAFAIATQLEPEILLIDEVLAVADEDFILSSVKKLVELREQGRTILLASHDLSMLSQVCTRAVWLERGHVAGDGPMEGVASQYHVSVHKSQGVR
jgi:lipopolysaccharide transport system ATP-binding protein